MLKNQRGSMLIELLVAVTVLGIFMSMFASMQVEYFKKFNKVSTQTGELASLRAIEEDILRDERYILPQSTNSALDAAVLGEEALANSFAAAKTANRCYDRDGTKLTDPKAACFFNVTFYRVAVLDRRLPAGSAFAKIPTSRLVIRMSYEQPKENKPTEKETVTVYATKLITSVFPY